MKSEKESSFKILFFLKIPAGFFSVAVAPLLFSTKDFQISTLDTIRGFLAAGLFSACAFFLRRSNVLIYTCAPYEWSQKGSWFELLKGEKNEKNM